MSDQPCNKKAVARFNWVSKKSYCCQEHRQELQKLCDHMGWPQVFIDLPDDTDKLCLSTFEGFLLKQIYREAE